MAHWVKPFGTSEPPARIEDNWIEAREVNLDLWHILSGPDQRNPPAMGTGDKVIFHAVGHARLFGAGELLGPPTWKEDDFWGTRFPWVYPVRVDLWLRRVSEGPRVSDVEPPKVLGRLQAGAPYAELRRDQYEALIKELLDTPSTEARIGFTPQ